MKATVRAFRALDSRGVTSIEFAFVFPVFLAMVFGIIEISRLIWWQVSLERAAAVASRCGGVAAADCKTVDQIAAKAAQSGPELPFVASQFTVTEESCGIRVSANVTFEFVTGFIGIPSQQLKATFCHPLTQKTL